MNLAIPISIGYTRATYAVADILFSAPWNPASATGNSWNLHTTEGNWSISLSLEEPPWRVEQFGLGPVTFYGFDLSLDNGSWSYTFKSLGGFQDGRLYPSDISITEPLGPAYQSARGSGLRPDHQPMAGDTLRSHRPGQRRRGRYRLVPVVTHHGRERATR